MHSYVFSSLFSCMIECAEFVNKTCPVVLRNFKQLAIQQEAIGCTASTHLFVA